MKNDIIVDAIASLSKIAARYTLCLILFSQLSVAQQIKFVPHTKLAATLINDGYENVIAQTSKNVTLVSFEDSRYRYSAIGVMRAFGHTVRTLPTSTTKVYFIVNKYGVPLFALESKNFQTLKSRKSGKTVRLPETGVSRRSAQATALARRFRPSNSSRFKTDLIFHPEVYIKLGDYDNPIAAQLNIVPELRTLLFKGLFLSASMIIPLYNELDAVGDYVRLGPTTLNYIAKFGGMNFMYASVGYFKGERYGVETGLKRFMLSGRLVLDARIGLSGFSVMDKGYIKYNDLDALTWSVSSQYFVRPLQLFFSFGVHRFIYKDYGLRLQAFRFFHDFQFGLWGLYAASEFNGGFFFSLPLPPKRYRKRKNFRIRPAGYFKWTYQAKRNTLNGYRLRANEITDEMFIRYNPEYIDSKLAVFQRGR